MKVDKKTVEDSMAESVYSVLPADTNIYGNLFGGKLVEWIDSIGALVGHRHSRKNVVTANIDNLSFLEPIRLGDSVILNAWINYVGTTSMEVQVDTHREKKDDCLRVLACTAFLTYVAIDEDGRPTPVPELILKTEEQKKRFREAQQRKETRLQKKV
ncbi:MAG TPA: acyl-CoA thioesterase [Euryarchaeota archaeon]|nr:acyl-CoA thioesterase [Euryarchaeota archaeon]